MISLSALEFYRSRKAFSTLAAEAGPGGLVVASLEQRLRSVVVPEALYDPHEDEEEAMSEDADDKDQLPVELSICSTSSGVNRLGGITLKSTLKQSLVVERSASVLKWNSTGKVICAIICGEVILIDLSWKHPTKEGNWSYASVALRDDEDEEDISQFYTCSLRVKSRKAISASSIWLCNNGSHILVGSDRGM